MAVDGQTSTSAGDASDDDVGSSGSSADEAPADRNACAFRGCTRRFDRCVLAWEGEQL
jgi:hypothetical protein